LSDPTEPREGKPAGKTPGGLPLRALECLSRWLAVGAEVLGAAICLFLTAMVGYSVFMRYVVNQPQTWTDELAGYLMVLLVMLGVAEVARRGDHIGVDILTQRLGPRGRWLAEIWGTVTVIAVAGAILVSSLEMVEFSYSFGLISEGYVEAPMWIPQSAIPLGMGLLLLAALSRLFGHLVAGPGSVADGR
jgi:C4-dicarboxylate transporter, DctQ subunit